MRGPNPKAKAKAKARIRLRRTSRAAVLIADRRRIRRGRAGRIAPDPERPDCRCGSRLRRSFRGMASALDTLNSPGASAWRALTAVLGVQRGSAWRLQAHAEGRGVQFQTQRPGGRHHCRRRASSGPRARSGPWPQAFITGIVDRHAGHVDAALFLNSSNFSHIAGQVLGRARRRERPGTANSTTLRPEKISPVFTYCTPSWMKLRVASNAVAGLDAHACLRAGGRPCAGAGS